jgi:hypothetical protein
MAKGNKQKILILSTIVLFVVIGLFSFKSDLKVKNAEASSSGYVVGYAWGATTDAPYGGMGWLNFNCKAPTGTDNNSLDSSACAGASGDWGVKIDTTSGKLSGDAWSNNLGWLSFDQKYTSECFNDTDTVSPQTATVTNIQNPNGGMNIVGWARFIAADQAGDNSGGWDGCVSFKDKPVNGPSLYSTNIDYPSGTMSGYAWGSNVVGWISFDCKHCNSQVVLEPDVLGCTDPSAINYNSSATVPDGSCTYPPGAVCEDPAANNVGDPLPCTYDPDGPGGGSVSLNLAAAPAVVTAGSGNYGVVLDWTSNDDSAFDGSCVGNVTKNGSSINISNWSVNNLPLPNDTRNINIPNPQVSDHFVFTIHCHSTDGTEVACASVNVQSATVNPNPPTVDLKIVSPNVLPTDYYHEEVPPFVSGGTDVKLDWQEVNVDSCIATSEVFANGSLGATSNNIEWNNTDVSDPDILTQTLTVGDDPLNPAHNTIFSIKCLPDDTDTYGSDPIYAKVCMKVQGVDFPQCPVNSAGGTPPSYQEI